MKSLKIISFLLLASFFFFTGRCVKSSEAQPPFISPGSQPPQTELKGSCRKDPSITFTEEQAKEVVRLQQSFL
ncbi:MAG TPA: hypothetical protein VEL68_16730, partial [Thermodesulfobacteriota bacterium]|nr:hypothetical protein [Thermodesulfobacteriota bacterium]